jgi:hypothetical protein
LVVVVVDKVTAPSGLAQPLQRFKEIRRNEFAPEVSIADTSIPGSGLFFSTDNEMMIAPRTSVLAVDTEGSTLDTAWATGHTGSGAATQADGELFITTGSTANSRGQLTTTRIGRRRSGATQWYIGVWRLDALGTANNVRRWGVYDDNNGFFFEVRSDGLWVGYRKNGVDTFVAAGAMNGPMLAADIDLTKMNQFNIFYGGLSCRWQVNGRVLHAIGAGVPSAALTASINLPLRAETINSSGQTAVCRLIGRGVSFHRVSPNGVVPAFRRVTGAGTTVIEQGAGTLHRVIVGTPSASATMTLYDNTAASGTVISLMTVPASAQNPFVVEFGTEFNVGLTVVMTGSSDVTIIYD